MAALVLFSCGEMPLQDEHSSVESEVAIGNEQHAGWLCLSSPDRNNTFDNRMAYATTDNFLKEKIYPCAECWLRDSAASALITANDLAKHSGYSIILYDCYRPTPLQQKMFDIFPDPKYVADPKKGSIHNKGCAVDVSLADINGPLDMGTEFDDFSEKAHPDYAELSAEVKANRKLLRDIMREAGFEPYKYEWWHFNLKNAKQFENEDFVWSCD